MIAQCVRLAERLIPDKTNDERFRGDVGFIPLMRQITQSDKEKDTQVYHARDIDLNVYFLPKELNPPAVDTPEEEVDKNLGVDAEDYLWSAEDFDEVEEDASRLEERLEAEQQRKKEDEEKEKARKKTQGELLLMEAGTEAGAGSAGATSAWRTIVSDNEKAKEQAAAAAASAGQESSAALWEAPFIDDGDVPDLE